MEAHRLLGLISNLRLDNEKVDIAVGTGLSASVRAKKNHLGFRSSRRQAAPGLGNQGVVNYLHSPKSWAVAEDQTPSPSVISRSLSRASVGG